MEKLKVREAEFDLTTVLKYTSLNVFGNLHKCKYLYYFLQICGKVHYLFSQLFSNYNTIFNYIKLNSGSIKIDGF